MPTPKYPKDFGTEFMKLRREVTKAFSDANLRKAAVDIVNGAFRVYDAGSNKIIELGKMGLDYGMKVYNLSGQTVIRAGALPDGSYGLEAVDPATGNHTSLATLAFGQVTQNQPSSIAPSSASATSMGGPTVGPVTVTGGKALGFMSATMDVDVGEGVSAVIVGAGPGGASYLSDPLTLRNNITGSGLGGSISGSFGKAVPISGITNGSWTFEMQYIKISGTGNPAVSARSLTILPF